MLTTILTRGIHMSEIILRALAGALILASILGPLGSFVVWRRMAYFGDTIAHASLLGVALSLLLGQQVPMTLMIVMVALLVAFTLSWFTRDTRFYADTVLGILAHGALAMGLVLVALNRDMPVDVNAYLFGDILAVDWGDIGVLAALALGVSVFLAMRWRRLLMTTLDPAIAKVEGVDPAREQLGFTLVLAAVIAVSIKLTGILLITALLIIPAAAARFLSRSPQQMAALASVAGMVSVSAGMAASIAVDVPTAPMMVVAACGVFLLCLMVAPRRA